MAWEQTLDIGKLVLDDELVRVMNEAALLRTSLDAPAIPEPLFLMRISRMLTSIARLSQMVQHQTLAGAVYKARDKAASDYMRSKHGTDFVEPPEKPDYVTRMIEQSRRNEVARARKGAKRSGKR